MASKKLINQINNAPNEPGVYVYKGINNRVLYVGKAIKLKVRLKSYLDINTLRQYPKTKQLMQNAYSVEYYTTDTELEALVLEANLIKKYKPKYNVNLKDDKKYKLIEVKKSKNGSYRVSTARTKKTKATYFGPYPSGTAVNKSLRDLRKIFPFRDCSETKYNYYKKINRPCLYGFIGICEAPCLSKQNTKTNNENVKKIKQFLKGNYKKVLNQMEKDMKIYSKNLEYEKAAKVRDKLNYYKYLSHKYKSSTELITGVGEIEQGGFTIEYLVKILSFYFPKFKNIKDYKNFRTEFFDISNIGSEIIIGSQIATKGESFDKQNYRKYKIRNQVKQDDFNAMEQTLTRRIKNTPKWGTPNLIVIDGGKGQLSKVLQITKNIPTIALAKKEETIFLKPNQEFERIDLNKNDPALQFLIKGRNEVHRFGVTYSQKLKRQTINK